MCNKKPIQACSCCPKAFCPDHVVCEAVNAEHPISHSGGCQMFICNFCQLNPNRVNASYLHIGCLSQGCFPQQLFTASGLWLSMYLKGRGPPLTAHEFSARCFKRDLADFEQKVRVHEAACNICLAKRATIEFCRESRVVCAGSRLAETLGPCTGWNLARLSAAETAWFFQACIHWNSQCTSCQESLPWLSQSLSHSQ